MVRRILVNVRREFCFKVALWKRLSGFRWSTNQIPLRNKVNDEQDKMLTFHTTGEENNTFSISRRLNTDNFRMDKTVETETITIF